MSDEAPAGRSLTIRVADQVFTDVADYVVLVRTKDNGIETLTSSYCWAHGAMEKTLALIHGHNAHEAEGGDE